MPSRRCTRVLPRKLREYRIIEQRPARLRVPPAIVVAPEVAPSVPVPDKASVPALTVVPPA